MARSELPDPRPDVEDDLAELAGCVEAYLTRGDPAPLRSESASRLATAVAARIESAGRSRMTIAQARVLGPFFWYRYLLRDEGDDGRADQVAGLRYFTGLAGSDLASVPRELQVLLSGSGMVGDGPYQWFQQGLVLLARAEVEPDTVAVTRCIELFTMALDTPGLPAGDLATVLSSLGLAYRIRYERRSDPRDLDEAIRAGRSAAEAAGSDGAEQAIQLGRLTAALQTRFQHAGDRRDLDEAIAATRSALAALDDRDPAAAICLLNGSGGLYLRFAGYGALTDLDEAIEMARRVETALPLPSTDGHNSDSLPAVAATNLAVYLKNRYEHTGRAADLDDSISAGRRAVARAGTDHPDHASKLSNLSTGLLARYQRDGAATDLDEAVDLAERAVRGVQADDWNDANCWSNLANVLSYRYRRDGTRGDLDAALDAARRAVAAATDRHGSLDLFRRNLSLILLGRFHQDGRPADMEEACSLLRAVYRSVTAPASMRLESAVSMIAAPLPDLDQRLEAAVAAVGLLPLVAGFALGRQDQEYALAGPRGLGSDASALAMATERASLAVELLEQGRAVLWTQALDLRTDLTDLGVTRPELVARLDTIRRELDAPPS